MEKEISSAVIMAAGLGTRLLPFTQYCTKALMPVMGVPVVQYAVDLLRDAGVKQVALNVHHRFEETKNKLSLLDYSNMDLVLSDESRLLLGSGGGMAKALGLLGVERAFLINADVLSDMNWSSLAAQHFRLRSQWGVDMTLALLRRSPTAEKYPEILFDPETHLMRGIGGLNADSPFFIGAAVLESEAFKGVSTENSSDFVSDLLLAAVQKQKVGIFLNQGFWSDIGTPKLWLETHLELMKKLELGCFSSSSSRLWRKRIETDHVRLGQHIWAHRDFQRMNSFMNQTEWCGPIFLGQSQSLQKKILLGPKVVLYGELDKTVSMDHEVASGIGFGGQWVACL